MEPMYKASGNYYPAPNSQQQPGYWSEYTGAVTQGPGGPGRHTAEPLPPGGGHCAARPCLNPAVITPSLTRESRRPTTILWILRIAPSPPL